MQKYLEMHRLVDEPDGTTTLYIGARNWPTPIPLVHGANGWYFETEAGKKEILYRRIGRNEMSAIRVCQELAAAEHEYHDAQHSLYAQAIFSDEGQHNGLYWRRPPANPIAPSDRWWRTPSLEVMTRGGAALRFLIAATTSTS